jgi:hypothetical protein
MLFGPDDDLPVVNTVSKSHPGWSYRTYVLTDEEIQKLRVIPVLARSFKSSVRFQFPDLKGEGWVEIPDCKIPYTLIDWIDDQKGTVEGARTRGRVHIGWVDNTNLRLWGAVMKDNSIVVTINKEPVLLFPSHGKLNVEKVEFPYD